MGDPLRRQANRFLEPILSSMIQESDDLARKEQLERYLQDVSTRLYASTNN